jgi:hypothetical protein
MSRIGRQQRLKHEVSNSQPLLVHTSASGTHPNVLSRLCAVAERALSASFSLHSAWMRSKNANGICRPYSSSATARNAVQEEQH